MQRKLLSHPLSFILISAIFVFLLPTTVDAAWTKFPGNPVLLPGGVAAWDSNSVFSPTILFDGTKFKMWYEGRDGSHQQIGYATSGDGVTWIKYPNNPVLPAGSKDGWELDATEPMVIFDNNIYKMWYTSMRLPQPTCKESFQIRYAFSEDGVNWTKHPNPVLRGEPGTWECEGVSQPYVIKEGNVYKMWYSARDGNGIWRIGYATSLDGINWNKYTNNPNFPSTPVLYADKPWEYSIVGKPSVLHEGDIYKIWYHAGPIVPYNIGYAISNDGINWIKPVDNPLLTLGPPGDFDYVHLGLPNVLKFGADYYMWYSGYDGNKWQIGFASTGPFPTPTPPYKSPIILLPGLGASWNFQKIFLGKDVPQSEWKMTPFVKHYENLIDTLDAADYTKEKDLFVFNYDWTKPVSKIAQDLKNYIDEVVDPPKGQSTGKKIKLIGHSLGGLVGRAYIQENPGGHQVEQLITLGSPHKGAVQVYKAWEGGEIHDLLKEPLRLGAELLIALRGRGYKNKVEAIRKITPALKDLLFIDDYLKEYPSGRIIPERTYSERNHWLKKLGIDNELKNILSAVVGKIADTLRWLKVVPPSQIDIMLGRWRDGKPVEEEFEIGDKTVLALSAGPDGTNTTEVPLDHGDLVRTKEGIETILSLLGIKGVPAVVNPYPPDSPFLVFVLASPGNLRVTNPLGQKAGFDIFPPTIPNALFLPQEKMVTIPGAIDGEYKVEVVGEAEAGSYRLIIGHLTEKQDIWQEYQGEIEPSKTDTYVVNFDNTLKTTPFTLAHLIREKLKNLLREVAKEKISLRKKVRIEGQVTKIFAEFEPVEILLQFKRNKEAKELIEKTLLDSLNLGHYLERNHLPLILDHTREIINYLDQLQKLLSD